MSTYDVESYLVDAGLHEYVTGLNREKVSGTVKILSQIDRGGLGPALL